MKKQVDCLLIGSYEMNLKKTDKITRSGGTTSPAYRSFSHNFLYDGKQPKGAFELFKESDRSTYYKNLPIGGEKYEMFHTTIAYLGTYLKKRRYSFDFINNFNLEQEELKEKLINDEILTIAILTTHYLTPFPIRDLVSFIKKYNTSAKIIIGGPYIFGEFCAKDEKAKTTLKRLLNADIFVESAYGENTLAEIIEALKVNKGLEKIDNIHFKTVEGDQITQLIPEEVDLSENLVDWTLFKDVLPNQVFLRTSVSCKFSCSFCEFHSRMGAFKYISISDIEQELDAIESTGRVKTVHFIDDTFNFPTERFKEVVKLIFRKKYSFKWSCLLRCQYLDRETVALMAESGCEAVQLGIESGNDIILKNMNKQATVEQFERGLSLLHEYNIVTCASFIIGFPGETYETVKDTIDFIERNKPTFYIVNSWFCSRLTPIWEQREKYGLKDTEWGFNWTHNSMDSKEAIDIVESLIEKIKGSTYIRFHLQEITHLLNHGFTVQQIVQFSKLFKNGLIAKIKQEENNQSDPNIFTEMKNIFSDIKSELSAL